MALTATATRSLQREVVKTLGMIDPVVVNMSLDKPDMIFTASLCTTLEETSIPLMEQLEAKRMHMDRVLMYCQHQDEGAQLYLLFCMRLGEMSENLQDVLILSRSVMKGPMHLPTLTTALSVLLAPRFWIAFFSRRFKCSKWKSQGVFLPQILYVFTKRDHRSWSAIWGGSKKACCARKLNHVISSVRSLNKSRYHQHRKIRSLSPYRIASLYSK